MFILGNLLIAVGMILNKVIEIYYFILIVRVLISWVNPDPYNLIVQILYRITEPILRPFRRIVPLGGIGLDISPIFAMLALFFIQRFFVFSLVHLGYRLGGGGTLL
ncbi:MAG: YggT family protein [Candidatus Omnitrophica bacterium]|nr:YggT family protein [Candidatus Omnitrophota bacterium]